MSYRHDQSSPSSVWVIQHNIGSIAPIVDVWSDIDGSLVKIMPKRVEVVDLTTCRVYFNNPQHGTAIIA